jgi:hypothetical protein
VAERLNGPVSKTGMGFQSIEGSKSRLSVRSSSAAVRPNMATEMTEHDDQAMEDAVHEAEEVRTIRAERDRHLSPEERLRRVDALCRQIASIRPVSERR